jgi:F-type H+-transporting ATPase subunit epsilon
LVARIATGAVRILETDGEWVDAVVTEGFMEVKQNQVVVLVDTAEWPFEIDEKRAEEARRRAEERLQMKLGRIEYLRTQAALRRAMSRLKIKRKHQS